MKRILLPFAILLILLSLIPIAAWQFARELVAVKTRK